MKKYTGKSVYGSVVIGKVSLPKIKTLAVKRVRVEDIQAEKQRLEEAKRVSVIQLCEIYRKAECVLENSCKPLISAGFRSRFQVCNLKNTDTYARLTFFCGKAEVIPRFSTVLFSAFIFVMEVLF